jgi:hypothetical protein
VHEQAGGRCLAVHARRLRAPLRFALAPKAPRPVGPSHGYSAHLLTAGGLRAASSPRPPGRSPASRPASLSHRARRWPPAPVSPLRIPLPGTPLYGTPSRGKPLFPSPTASLRSRRRGAPQGGCARAHGPGPGLRLPPCALGKCLRGDSLAGLSKSPSAPKGGSPHCGALARAPPRPRPAGRCHQVGGPPPRRRARARRRRARARAVHHRAWSTRASGKRLSPPPRAPPPWISRLVGGNEAPGWPYKRRSAPGAAPEYPRNECPSQGGARRERTRAPSVSPPRPRSSGRPRRRASPRGALGEPPWGRTGTFRGRPVSHLARTSLHRARGRSPGPGPLAHAKSPRGPTSAAPKAHKAKWGDGFPPLGIP